MTGFSHILAHFPPAKIRKHKDAFPDSLLQGGETAATWPKLQGVVGVFFTSRSGSTALSRMAESHFNVQRVGEALNMPILQTTMHRRGLGDCRAALASTITGASPAGWFMFKSGGAGLINGARMGFLDHYGATLRPVILLRRDIVGQALSVFAANVTGRYHSTQTGEATMTEADFDRDRIVAHIATICAGNARLDRIIGYFDHTPQLLIYEDFRGGDPTAPMAVLAATGLPRRTALHDDPRRRVSPITHPLTAQFRARLLENPTAKMTDLIARHDASVADWRARTAADGLLSSPRRAASCS